MSIKRIALLALLVVGSSTSTLAYTVNTDAGTQYTIGALTSYETHGNEMDGMTVIFDFADGSSSTLFWADAGVDAGGVSGGLNQANWSLSLTGDTYTAPWNLSISGAYLKKLTLIGSTGLTAFDMTEPDTGTAGSSSGHTFSTASTLPINATYKNIIALNSDAPVGDLYERLIVDFGGDGLHGDLTFYADTDNIPQGSFYEPSVPGPASILPFGLGLLAALKRKRNRK